MTPCWVFVTPAVRKSPEPQIWETNRPGRIHQIEALPNAFATKAAQNDVQMGNSPIENGVQNFLPAGGTVGSGFITLCSGNAGLESG